MTNGAIANVFHEMGDLLQIQGGDEYRIRAFRRAARVIESLPEPAETMLRFNTLQQVPGIGEGTVQRIKQIVRMGTCDEHHRLLVALPSGLRDMLEVKGLGAKTVRLIWHSLRIGTVDDLERAARLGELRRLPRLGEVTEEKILAGIAAWRERISRVPLHQALQIGNEIAAALRELPQVVRAELAGSARRRKPTIGDLDILVAADDAAPVAARFLALPQVTEVLLGGTTRCSVRLTNRQQADLRVIPPHNFGAGMHYFTGSKLHNIAIRERANRMQLRISEHGVFRRSDDRLLNSCATEEEIFAAVELPFIAPELRENIGEVEAAASGRLPTLVTVDDLRGDLHMHTNESDGVSTARDMIEAAIRIGHDYIAITDHSKSLTVANGLDERRVLAQIDLLRELERRAGGIRVLPGNEVDILGDGSLDLAPEVLAKLDWVVASVHSGFEMDAAAMSARIIRAMETGLVDCIGHPTGRKLGQRPGYELDMETILGAARRLDVALEVNGNPRRMDLDGTLARQCKEYRVPVVISTDAHAPWHLEVRQFGLAAARRGWLEAKDVLNTRPASAIEERRRERMRKRGFAVPRDIRVVAERTELVAPPPELAAGVTALEGRLQCGLDAELRARVERFLLSPDDAELATALARLGPNPIQAAYNLLLQTHTESGARDDDSQ